MSISDEDRAELEAMQRASKKLSGGNFNPHLSIPEGVKFLETKHEGLRKLNFFRYKKTIEGGVFDVGTNAAYREYAFHKIGPQETKVLCPNFTFGKPCTMCQKRAEAFRDPRLSKDEKKEAARPFFLSKRRMYNVADAENNPQNVLVYDVADNCFPERLDAKIAMAGEAMAGWNNPQHGKTLAVMYTKESTGGGGSYRSAANIEIVPREFKYDKGLMGKIIDLDTLLVEVSNEDLWQMFLDGGVPDDDGDDSTHVSQDGGRTNSQQVEDWAETAVTAKPKTKAAVSVPAAVEPEPELDADTPEEAEEEAPFEEPEPEPVKAAPKKAATPATKAAAPAKKAAPKAAADDDGGWD